MNIILIINVDEIEFYIYVTLNDFFFKEIYLNLFSVFLVHFLSTRIAILNDDFKV